MRFELVRHFEVEHEWAGYQTSREVVAACDNYNRAGIRNPFPLPNKSPRVFVSSFVRTKMTSDYLDNRDGIIADSLLDELTLNPFMPTERRLPSWLWVRVWKLSWSWNLPLARETKKQTLARVREFIDRREEEGEDITVVGHALIFTLMLRELKRRGYEGTYKPAFFNNGELREFVKSPEENYGVE